MPDIILHSQRDTLRVPTILTNSLDRLVNSLGRNVARLLKFTPVVDDFFEFCSPEKSFAGLARESAIVETGGFVVADQANFVAVKGGCEKMLAIILLEMTFLTFLTLESPVSETVREMMSLLPPGNQEKIFGGIKSKPSCTVSALGLSVCVPEYYCLEVLLDF